MTLNGNLWNAILAMDAYNRGYGAGIDTPELSDAEGTKIGIYTVSKTSTILGPNVDQSAGFYAVAYDSNNDGKTDIISYRGTDDDPQFKTSLTLSDFAALFFKPSPIDKLTFVLHLADTQIKVTPDVWNGWFVGAGADQSAQALLAYEFYKDVVGIENVISAEVTFTGHSLGGGLAGMVAGTYGKPATIFDHMPYQKALENQWESIANPNSPDYDALLKGILFGSYDVSVGPDFLLHHAFSIKNEALSYIRNNGIFPALITTSTINEDVISLGSEFDAFQSNLPEVLRLTAVQLHSQALQVIRLFFSWEDFSSQIGDWNAAGPYFWPVLFDPNFAQAIGMANISGELNQKGKYDDILKTIIAYSVIDEGPDEARPFGDTAVCALYNDANDLGKAIEVIEYLSHIKSFSFSADIFVSFSDLISKVFVEYAGQLALNSVLKEESPQAIEGVLKYIDDGVNHSLLVDLDQRSPAWLSAHKGGRYIHSSDELLDYLFSDYGFHLDSHPSYPVEGEPFSIKDFVDAVVFADSRNGGVVDVSSIDREIFSSLYAIVADSSRNYITGTDGADIILGGAGDDRIYEGVGGIHNVGGQDKPWTGQDILAGGAGDDEYIFSGRRFNGAVFITETSGHDKIIIRDFKTDKVTYTSFGGKEITVDTDTVGLILQDGYLNISIRKAGNENPSDPYGDLLPIEGKTDASAIRWTSYEVITLSVDDILNGNSVESLVVANRDFSIFSLYEMAQDYFETYSVDELNSQIGSSYFSSNIGTESSETFLGETINHVVDYLLSNAPVVINLLTGVSQGGFAEGDILVNVRDIIGSTHDDILTGDSNDNVFQGGPGNDILSGGVGDDTYIFAAGDGQDIITETSGFDTLAIQGDITLANLQFSRIGDDLHIEIASGVTVTGFYSGNPDLILEQISFGNGSTYDLTALLSTPANQSPTLQNDDFTGDQDTAITGNLFADNGHGVDADPDGDVLSVTAGTFATTSGGTIVLQESGDFTYTPASGFSGADSYSYTAQDGHGGTANALASFTVNPVQEVIHDKLFVDDITFPALHERVNIVDLVPPGTPALGVVSGNLSVDFDAEAVITFRQGFAGYNNTLGLYGIAEDGTIHSASILWENVKTAGYNAPHDIALPVGQDGGSYGFFIIANGDRVNHGYDGMDFSQGGNVAFVYHYGEADERAAKITDSAADIDLLYDDGEWSQLLAGLIYHTTERDDSTDLNPDGKIHVVSGLPEDGDGNILSIGFEDLPSTGDADYEDVWFDLDIKSQSEQPVAQNAIAIENVLQMDDPLVFDLGSEEETQVTGSATQTPSSPLSVFVPVETQDLIDSQTYV